WPADGPDGPDGPGVVNGPGVADVADGPGTADRPGVADWSGGLGRCLLERVRASRQSGAPASTASAQPSPAWAARNPTASGPNPATRPDALSRDTATPLRPGRLPYSSAWSTGYQAAVTRLSAPSTATLGQKPGTSRNAG